MSVNVIIGFIGKLAHAACPIHRRTEMNILIGADLVPTASNQDLFLSGNSTELVGPELKKILDEAEYRIFNLEIRSVT